MASLFWGASPFDELVDKATSELLPVGGSDIALNLEICDQIRSKSVTPLAAMRSIKRRIDHKNPNVQLLALELADTCTKNGGDTFLTQVASREFMDDLVSIVKSSGVNRDVKQTILRLVQSWARGMEGNSELKYVGETYKNLKSSGFEFPPESPVAATATLYQTATAPAWTDSDRCMRCREPFTMTFRKHHCRNCGQTFCQSCSSYTSRLDHFGINTEVRVCKDCHDKLTRKTGESAKKDSKKDGVGSREWVRREREKADKDLERAIALSLAEAKSMGHVVDEGPSARPAALSKGYPPAPVAEEEEDPDLAAAIKASLEEYQAMNVPSAPSPMPERPGVVESYFPQPPPPLPNYDLSDAETLTILNFTEAVENGASPRSIEELRERADRLRPRLVRSLDDTERKEQMLTEMHGKLAEVVRLFDSHLNAQLERRASTYRQPLRTQTYASYAPQRTASPQTAYTAPQQPYAAPQQQPYAPQQQYAPPQQQAYAPAPQAYQEPQQQQQPQQYTSPAKQEHPIPPIQAYPPSPVRSNTGMMSPPPAQAQAPTSPVMQMSAPYGAPISAPVQQAPPTPAVAPPVVTYQAAPVSQPQPYANAPGAPSRQQSFAAPAAPAQPAYATSPAPAPQQPSQPVYAQPPAQHYQPTQAPPVQQQLPTFPEAPHTVFPSAFPEAPADLPSGYGYAPPVREEKEVALIEL